MSDYLDTPLPGMEGPGQARRNDPATAKAAAEFARARAGSARVLLLEAHADHPSGLTDEEAARYAHLDPASEYATRCSELKRATLLEDTDRTRMGQSGTPRQIRQITPHGWAAITARREQTR